MVTTLSINSASTEANIILEVLCIDGIVKCKHATTEFDPGKPTRLLYFARLLLSNGNKNGRLIILPTTHLGLDHLGLDHSHLTPDRLVILLARLWEAIHLDTLPEQQAMS